MTDQATKPATTGSRALVTRFSELKTWEINWLWPGRIARAKLTLIGGPAGCGKSALAAKLVAAVTTGGAWPCHEGSAPQGSVILVCPYGDPDILALRLKAAGANIANIHMIREVQGSKGPRPFDVATDVPLLDATLRTIKQVRVIVIDAINLPGGRTAVQATRALLEPLAALAKDHDISIVAMTQAPGNEGAGLRPASFDLAALSSVRSAFLIAVDPADESRRLLLQVKNEIAPDSGTLGFRITAHALAAGQTAARIAFESHHDPVSARQFFARRSRGFDSAKAEAVKFVRDLFGGASELSIRQVEDAARAVGLVKANQGLAQSRVLRDARLAMGLKIARAVSGADWVWAKPGGRDAKQTSPPAPPATHAMPQAPTVIPGVPSPPLQAKQMPNRDPAGTKNQGSVPQN
jgi:hypothetical protein